MERARVISAIVLGITLAVGAPVRAGVSTELMEAAVNGDTAKLQAMISSGAQVNDSDKGGLTPLMVAAFYGHS